MPRTLDATLSAALDARELNEPIIRAYISVDDVPTTLVSNVVKYTQNGTKLNIEFYPSEADLDQQAWYTVQLERGLKIGGTEYTVKSMVYYQHSVTVNLKKVIWEGYIFPKVSRDFATNGTYEATITDYFNYSGIVKAVTQTYRAAASTWKGYAFLLETGKSLTWDRFESLLKQKNLIHLTDIQDNSVAVVSMSDNYNFLSAATAHHTIASEHTDNFGTGISGYKGGYVWTDNTGTIRTSGFAPFHNLGYWPSATPPNSVLVARDPGKIVIPFHLKYLKGDTANIIPAFSTSTDITTVIDVTETFNPSLSTIPWRIEITCLQFITGTDGGSVPSGIASSGNYINIDTDAFGNVLSDADSNIQHALDTLDDHLHNNNYTARTGFPNRTDTALSFDDATRTVTLSKTGTSFSIFIAGVEYEFTANQTRQIANSTGLHFVYFNTSGTLTSSTTPWTITSDNVPVAIVYYRTTTATGAIQDERHSADRNKAWHQWAHDTIGTRYESGLATTFTNTTFSSALGIIHDEDIEHSIAAKTACRLWYRASTVMAFESNITTPYKAAAGTLQFDSAGTLTNVTANRYISSWVYATNDVNYPIYVVVGQAQYTTIAAARADPQPTFPNLNTREWTLIYRAIYQNAAGTPTYVEATDYRTVSSLPGGVVSSLPASSVTFTPTGAIAATNAQAAIEELDSEKSATTHTHADASTSAAGFAPIATAPSANELNVLGIANGETAYANKDMFNTTAPTALGTAAAGTAIQASRSDHVHPQVSAIGARAYKSAAVQSVNDSSATAITLDGETFDTSAFHDNVTNNTRLTIPSGQGAYYLITFNIVFASNATGYRQAQVKLNNTTNLISCIVPPSGTVANINGVFVYYLSATDYIELIAYQTSGGALNVNNGAGNTWLSAVKIGA